MRRCDELALCTEDPGRVTRRFLTHATRAAYDLVSGWMCEAGLEPHVDHAGNLIARRPPTEGDRVLLIGSHLDSVPNGGRYDGVLGVLLGLAVAEALRDSPLPFGLEVIGFSEEEGVRYSKPYLGSAAVAGCFRPEWLDRVDDEHIHLSEALRLFGCDPERIADAAYDPSRVIGYLEPHLEQGPVLERADSPVGVVSGIVGQSRLRLDFLGEAGHAGTTPMAGRRDALLAASRLVTKVRATASAVDGLHATVGKLEVTPNAPNVIPARVELSHDVRHPDDSQREAAVAQLVAAGAQLARGEGCGFRVLEQTGQGAVSVDQGLSETLAHAIAGCGHEPLRLASGAGHDAVVMAGAFPAAMLFVRHPGGVSHHPDERVDADDVAVAVRVLVGFVRRLATKIQSETRTEASR